MIRLPITFWNDYTLYTNVDGITIAIILQLNFCDKFTKSYISSEYYGLLFLSKVIKKTLWRVILTTFTHGNLFDHKIKIDL